MRQRWLFHKMLKQLGGLCAVMVLIYSCQIGKNLGEQRIEIGTNYAVFSIPYTPALSENPFDIVATASFAGEDGQRTRDALWFFANDSMHLRFAALEPGVWTFKTRSKNTKLKGYRGYGQRSERSG